MKDFHIDPAGIQSRRPPRRQHAVPLQRKEHFMDTLIDVAVADGRFKTLAKALTAAGLVDTP
jgi:hypothetical protein